MIVGVNLSFCRAGEGLEIWVEWVPGKDTFAEGFEPVTGGMATGHGLVGGTLKDISAEFHPTVAGPAGCMVSSAADLTRFFNLLHSGAIISAGSLKKMRSTYVHSLGGGNGYGLGLVVSQVDGETFYAHDGGVPGFSSSLIYWQAKNASVAVLLNAQEAKAGALVSGALKALP